VTFRRQLWRSAAFGAAVLVLSCIQACAGESLTNPPLPVLSGPYLGQTPPGLTAQRFGPAAIHANDAWFWHSGPGFSPDGLEMYWAKLTPSGPFQLAFSSGRDGQWTEPARPSFAGNSDENQPVFAPDGNSILYVSGASPGHIVRVTRTASGWSAPVSLGLPGLPSGGFGWWFSVVADGSVYADGDLRRGGQQDLFRFQRTGAGFGPAGAVSVNSTAHESAHWVAPDESYLLVSSDRAGGRGAHDIWAAFRLGDGTWSQAVNLGPAVNTSREEGSPSVTADGLYLFFVSKRARDDGYNPYWISAQVIDSARVRAGIP